MSAPRATGGALREIALRRCQAHEESSGEIVIEPCPACLWEVTETFKALTADGELRERVAMGVLADRGVSVDLIARMIFSGLHDQGKAGTFHWQDDKTKKAHWDVAEEIIKLVLTAIA